MKNSRYSKFINGLGAGLMLISAFINPSLGHSMTTDRAMPEESISTTASVPITPVLTRTTVLALPASVRLSGWVKDQMGNPIASAIYVIDNEWKPVGDIFTDDYGYYDVTVPGRERLSVSATPLGRTENLIEMEGGYLVSKYFELTKTIVPASENIEINFVLPPAAALRILAYLPTGTKMQMGEFNDRINPPGYWGYQNIYGIFPLDSFNLPMPSGASIGLLRAASHPDMERSQWEPCFGVPPGEAVYLMLVWEVPGIGTFPLRADNKGIGYNLDDGEIRSINLVYEFAETENRRALELKAGYEAQGYQFSPEIMGLLDEASADLIDVRNQTDEQNRALLSFEVLRLSIKAREQVTMEVAAKGIEARKNELTVMVQDEAGNPVPEVIVTYNQTSSDFHLSAHNLPTGPFLYPSYKATKEMGFEYVYDVALVWKASSPAQGVYDFSEHDAALERARVEGLKAVSTIAWLGSDNVPAWAENLEPAEFKLQLREFVMKAVEHYRGRVNYLIIAIEPSIQTSVGSRYLDLQFTSSYLTGVQPTELIELIRTAFDAAREVDSEIQFGYSAVPDYAYHQLNPLNFGDWPTPYSFLKSVLESGVRPDWIGVELGAGWGTVPLDLSTVAAIFQAYHDLSGLPILITEMPSYPSRTGDYGNKDPVPHVYWHEGMTQQVQAEWDTSVFKLAMGLPYVFGLNMLNAQPDNIGGIYGQPPTDCVEIDPYWCAGIGSDFLTYDYKRKQVYYALMDLFDSWRAKGSIITNDEGKGRFDGLGGTYSIGVTNTEGLLQTFETFLGPGSTVVTVKLDRNKAMADMQALVAEAQKAVDWSQNLGRQLDFNSLRSQLAEARSAMASGNFGSARTITELILETIPIQIDGNPDDWTGIQPINTAPPGGVAVNAPGIDLKALYVIRDDKYLYLMIEVYDPPITLQPGGIIGGISNPQFLIDLEIDEGNWHEVRTYLAYTGQMDIYRLTEPVKLMAALYTIAYGNVLELKVPLAFLDDPSHMSACAFVMAAKNGVDTVAKAFDGCVEVYTFNVSGNAGVAGATLSYTDGILKTATAASDGSYSFNVSYNWTGTVTPAKKGYTFVPVNKVYAGVTTDQASQDYTAIKNPIISGYAGAAGVTLSYTVGGNPKTVLSDKSGNYSLDVPTGWSGTVTPSLYCGGKNSLSRCYFTPAKKVYTNVTTNLVRQNYVMKRIY